MAAYLPGHAGLGSSAVQARLALRQLLEAVASGSARRGGSADGGNEGLLRVVTGRYGTVPGGVFFRVQVLRLLAGASSRGAGHYVAGAVFGAAGPLLLLLEAAGRYQPLLVTDTEMCRELGYRSDADADAGLDPTRAESTRRTNEARAVLDRAKGTDSDLVRTDPELQDQLRGLNGTLPTLEMDPGEQKAGTSARRTTHAPRDGYVERVEGASGGTSRAGRPRGGLRR